MYTYKLYTFLRNLNDILHRVRMPENVSVLLLKNYTAILLLLLLILSMLSFKCNII